jgi:hypothetical protein
MPEAVIPIKLPFSEYKVVTGKTIIVKIAKAVATVSEFLHV